MRVTGRRFEPVLDVRAALGETPFWSVAEQALYFADISGQRVFRFREGEALSSFDLPEPPGFIAPVTGGGLLAAMRSGIFLLGTDGAVGRRLAANPETHPPSRFNDGIVDPAGRLLIGTVDPEGKGRAGLYRLDERGLAPLLTGLDTSNGLAFSPDGRTLYHCDTPGRLVRAYDYDAATGEISGGRDFIRPDGFPDGAAVDAQGCYWTALYGGGRVERYSPGGELLAAFAVPARCPTMPAFGGADRTVLYLTTARENRSDEELAAYPLSGGLFSLEAGVAGTAARLFVPPP